MPESYNATIPPLLFFWEGPIIIKSESNMREHHFARHARQKKQQQALKPVGILMKIANVQMPCLFVLTRLYPRFLDTDNLDTSFKKIRDTLADFMIPGLAPGRADNDPRLSWQCKQEKSKLKGCRIQIYKG